MRFLIVTDGKCWLINSKSLGSYSLFLPTLIANHLAPSHCFCQHCFRYVLSFGKENLSKLTVRRKWIVKFRLQNELQIFPKYTYNILNILNQLIPGHYTSVYLVCNWLICGRYYTSHIFTYRERNMSNFFISSWPSDAILWRQHIV